MTAIAFLLAFTVGCILSLVRHPIYGLLTYVGAFYIDPYSRWWNQSIPDLRWSYTAAIATILGLIFRSRPRDSIPLRKQPILIGYVLFVLWCAIQTPWALDRGMHMELLNLSAKYALVMCLIYLCVDSEQHLKAFLWANVLGCFSLGWIAFTEYQGGRFEGFGGGAIGEANAGAIQLVSGVFVASSLFLVGRNIERVSLVLLIPFILNGVVTTISRSGFLALMTGGIIYNLVSPRRYATRVRVLSALALVLFVSLTGPAYWQRIDTISYGGEEVAGVDTGAGRLDIIRAQWRMFLDHPLGCGHRCTVTLSPEYMAAERLVHGGRSSHNTFMTLLVEQGIPGAGFYIALVAWAFSATLRLTKQPLNDSFAAYVSATVAILGATFVGDLFVDYLKLEVRMWFVAIAMVLLNMGRREVHTGVLAKSTILHPFIRD